MRQIKIKPSLIGKFCSSKFGGLFKTTLTGESNFNSAWERDAANFEKITLASGAVWLRNGEDYWQLFKSNEIEVESAVLGLLNYYGFIQNDGSIGNHRFEQGMIFLPNLIALVQHGFGVPVSVFEGNHYSEKSYCDSTRNGDGKNNFTHSEYCDAERQRDNTSRVDDALGNDA